MTLGDLANIMFVHAEVKHSVPVFMDGRTRYRTGCVFIKRIADNGLFWQKKIVHEISQRVKQETQPVASAPVVQPASTANLWPNPKAEPRW